MSFISILKTIALDLEHGIFIAANVGQAASPIITAIDPAAGIILALVCNSIVQVEQLVNVPGKGPAKKQIVTEIINATYPTTPNPAQLSTMIDALVATFNALSAIQTPPPSSPPPPAKTP